MDALRNLTQLTELYLNDNQINDLDALSNLTRLKWLFLNKNLIKSINALTLHRTSLRVLDLFGNRIENSFDLIEVIKSIIFIENYTHLKNISMDRKQIYFLFSLREQNSMVIDLYKPLTKTAKLYSRYKNYYISNYLTLVSGNLVDCQFQLDLIGLNILLNIDQNEQHFMNFYKQCRLAEIKDLMDIVYFTFCFLDAKEVKIGLRT